MQKIKSLQELKQLSIEIPITIVSRYGLLGLAKRIQYFDFSDSWKIVELHNGFEYSYTTEELILNTDIFKAILTGTLIIYKTMG